jgi:predicted RNA methylase
LYIIIKGAGCGLVSITLSLLGSKLVYATDLKEIVENITNSNLALNFDSKKDNIISRALEWYYNYYYCKIGEI